ncbi:MAG TPA: ParB/RepB/Spo0J family partition protein [Paracoccaceae bacterium]|nr:ParB/RepB/Spo0J family partition protein [Paracoccaceae bacterium]
MRRRRGFDVDLPEAPEAAPDFPAGKEAAPRRGPMASAVRETAESLRARAETEAAIRAENDALAHELVRLRALGLTAEPVPLDRVDAAKLIRDRKVEPDPDVEDLKESIRAIGLSNPIRVERAGERYELIQGWRRLHAYRALLAETGDPAFAAIPAGIVAPGDDLATSYRRMVDENLVRKDLSFAEMAELARAFAADPQTDCDFAEEAVTILYGSASPQKRSYVRAFAQLLEEIGPHLAHPGAIPRNLGLEVRRRLAEEGGREALLAALAAQPRRSEAQELSILRGFAEGEGPDPEAAPKRRGRGPAPALDLSVDLPGGPARCRVAGGRVTLQGPAAPTDDPERLARAVAAFYAALEG